MTDRESAQAAELYQTMCRGARALDKPVIAALNGFVLSGGLEVALMADMRIAARSAKLGLTDAELGFRPTGGPGLAPSAIRYYEKAGLLG